MMTLEKLQLLIDTFVCQNCDWYATQTDAMRPPYEIDIPDLHQRVSGGEIHPAGTCPACGALVQGLFDNLLVVDAEAGTYYALSGSQCLAYSGMTGPEGINDLDWRPLERMPSELLGQLIERFRSYLPGAPPRQDRRSTCQPDR